MQLLHLLGLHGLLLHGNRHLLQIIIKQASSFRKYIAEEAFKNCFVQQSC